MTTFLNTKQLSVPLSVPPNIGVQFVKPESYEFRVAEFVDKDGKITKVGLQVRTWEHDEYGSGNLKFDWKDVPRVVIDSTTGILVLK